MATYYPAHSNDDATEHGDGTYRLVEATLKVYSNTDPANYNYRCSGVRFISVAVAQGATISSATFNINIGADYDFNGVVYGNNVDDANDFNTEQDVIGRARTTANVSVVHDSWGVGAKAITVTSIIQEIVNRGSWGSGNDLALLFIANIDANKIGDYYAYDNGSNFASLDIIVAAGGLSIPVAMHHYNRINKIIRG